MFNFFKFIVHNNTKSANYSYQNAYSAYISKALKYLAPQHSHAIDSTIYLAENILYFAPIVSTSCKLLYSLTTVAPVLASIASLAFTSLKHWSELKNTIQQGAELYAKLSNFDLSAIKSLHDFINSSDSSEDVQKDYTGALYEHDNDFVLCN